MACLSVGLSLTMWFPAQDQLPSGDLWRGLVCCPCLELATLRIPCLLPAPARGPAAWSHGLLPVAASRDPAVLLLNPLQRYRLPCVQGWPLCFCQVPKGRGQVCVCLGDNNEDAILVTFLAFVSMYLIQAMKGKRFIVPGCLSENIFYRFRHLVPC